MRQTSNKSILSLDLFQSQSAQKHLARLGITELSTMLTHSIREQIVTPAQLVSNDPVKLFELKQKEEY